MDKVYQIMREPVTFANEIIIFSHWNWKQVYYFSHEAIKGATAYYQLKPHVNKKNPSIVAWNVVAVDIDKKLTQLLISEDSILLVSFSRSTEIDKQLRPVPTLYAASLLRLTKNTNFYSCRTSNEEITPIKVPSWVQKSSLLG